MTNLIMQYRIAKELSQEQLGELVGVQRAAVSKWEAGEKPSIQAAKKLEEISGGVVAKWMTRPDVWSPPEDMK